MAWCRPLTSCGIRGHQWVFSAHHIVLHDDEGGLGAKRRCSFVSGRQVTGVRRHVPVFRLLTPACLKTFAPMMFFHIVRLAMGLRGKSNLRRCNEAVSLPGFFASDSASDYCTRDGCEIVPRRKFFTPDASHVSIVPRMIVKPCTSCPSSPGLNGLVSDTMFPFLVFTSLRVSL